MRLPVDNANHLSSRRQACVGCQSLYVVGILESAIVFGSADVLLCHLVPHPQEDALQRVHFFPFNAAVHVAPSAHLLRSFYIIVGNVHPSRVCHLAVDYDNLSVVAVEHMVNPGKAQWVELVDFNAMFSEFHQMFLLQRTVVGVISEAVEQSTHLHSLLSFLCQDVKEQRCY